MLCVPILKIKNGMCTHFTATQIKWSKHMGKKQHFVPKFLLRQFSSDSRKRLISLFHLPSSQVIKGVSIKDQAYKKNIYISGSDHSLEEYLSMVEGDTCDIINKILLDESVSLTLKEELILKHFINLQISRTPRKIETIQGQVDKLARTAFRHDPRVKDFINDFTIHLTSPYHFTIALALQLTPMLFDLKISLLKNNSEQSVLLGQHPAIITNPFLYWKTLIGSKQGLALKGTLILLPISPNYVIALYDKQRYSLTDFVKIGILSQEDINKINLFQFCYTTDCIYFHDDNDEKINFDEYKNKTEKFRTNDKNIIRILEGKNKKGLRSEILQSTSREPAITPKFEFLALKVKAIFEDLGPTMRDLARDEVRHLLRK